MSKDDIVRDIRYTRGLQLTLVYNDRCGFQCVICDLRTGFVINRTHISNKLPEYCDLRIGDDYTVIESNTMIGKIIGLSITEFIVISESIKVEKYRDGYFAVKLFYINEKGTMSDTIIDRVRGCDCWIDNNSIRYAIQMGDGEKIKVEYTYYLDKEKSIASFSFDVRSKELTKEEPEDDYITATCESSYQHTDTDELISDTLDQSDITSIHSNDTNESSHYSDDDELVDCGYRLLFEKPLYFTIWDHMITYTDYSDMLFSCTCE